jgi:cytochrome c peroxidase
MTPASVARHISRSILLAVMSAPLLAQSGGTGLSLKSVAVPKPPDLDRYVRDEKALVALGKALFWDVQLSSDNRIACATCHFHAGADHRRQNQLSSTKDPVEQNWALGMNDFPFARGFVAAGHRAGSAGAFPRRFLDVSPEGGPDAGADLDGNEHPTLHGLAIRQVTRRNAPSVFNAVYVFRHFWDGRASDVFTGRTPFGDNDTSARVLVESEGTLAAVNVRIEKAGLASQAVGPPLDPLEMSYQGRSWPMLGRKMLGARPLALQQVAPDDSVLGPYANAAGRGLAQTHSYEALIHAAFQPAYWRSSARVDEHGAAVPSASRDSAGRGFLQQEYNFPLFLGLAIQAYESTLISDDSPYDRYLQGQVGALTDLERTGLEMFQRRACATCHVDPELTLSSYSGVYGYGPFKGLGPEAGFVNTGVEPAQNDLGIFGTNPRAQPLARPDGGVATARRGAFKTPSLRNVELTGPYFHTGSKSTLAQIIDFYTIGGDYPTGTLTSWSPDSLERIAMPAFMRSFTDDRVRFERAPFDHPQLCVSAGHVDAEPGGVVPTGPAARQLPERWASIPAVGAKGNAVPLQTFQELLLGIGNNGSRAHTLTEPCSFP